MKRRKFLTAAGASIALPSLINGFNFKAFGQSKWMSMLTASQVNTDKVLVIINLNGGNDGLNTVLPIDQYDTLAAARPNMILPESSILSLNGSSATGLHPAMTALQSMYNENKLGIIQSVGYPDPNFSHFRATDIWASGSDSNQVVSTGIIGRFLDHAYPGYPIDYPNETMPDPLAVQIGTGLPLLFQGANTNNAMTISGEEIFQEWQTPTGTETPDSYAGIELAYIRTVIAQTEVYADQILAAYNSITTQYSDYPAAGSNRLADQLKIVARLVAGGLKTRVYLVSLGGFDNHADQVDAADTTTGTHANLLSQLSEAIHAFQSDLEFLNINERVMGMTFSEFGRRIKSNGSLGTDHGAAAPLFLFGTQVSPGIMGDNPIIPTSVSENDNLPMQYDFRTVYASILKDWFCVDESGLMDIMLQEFPAYNVCNGDCTTIGINSAMAPSALSIKPYSNPFTNSLSLAYSAPNGKVLIQLFDCNGKIVDTLVNQVISGGSYTISMDTQHYPAGNYYAQLRWGSQQKSVLVMKVK